METGLPCHTRQLKRTMQLQTVDALYMLLMLVEIITAYPVFIHSEKC